MASRLKMAGVYLLPGEVPVAGVVFICPGAVALCPCALVAAGGVLVFPGAVALFPCEAPAGRVALVVLAANFLADLVYVALDPRADHLIEHREDGVQLGLRR